MSNYGYVFIDMMGTNLMSSEKQTKTGIFARSKALLATGKPVYATNCIMGAGKPCSPISVVAWQEDSDTIIATGHVLRVEIGDDDGVTVTNLVAG